MQVYDLSNQFLPKEWIMEKWEDGYYITAMAGSTSGSSLVVMSKGTPYTQQSYKVLPPPPPRTLVRMHDACLVHAYIDAPAHTVRVQTCSGTRRCAPPFTDACT